MSDQSKSRSLIFDSAVHRIKVRAHLNPRWSESLQGMVLVHSIDEQNEPITEITGRLPDQAALMGVLEHLYICGVHLLSLECLTPCGMTSK